MIQNLVVLHEVSFQTTLKRMIIICYIIIKLWRHYSMNLYVANYLHESCVAPSNVKIDAIFEKNNPKCEKMRLSKCVKYFDSKCVKIDAICANFILTLFVKI